MEKGHPLAASKAAWVSPALPYVSCPYPSMGQSPAQTAAQSAVPGTQYPGPGMAWDDCNAVGINAGEGGKGYSLQSYRGLDGVGQALSAALQVIFISHPRFCWQQNHSAVCMLCRHPARKTCIICTVKLASTVCGCCLRYEIIAKARSRSVWGVPTAIQAVTGDLNQDAVPSNPAQPSLYPVLIP